MSPGLSNNALAARGLPRGVSRSDLGDESRDARVERRLGRRLTAAESVRCHYARNTPMPLESRAGYHARGFRLVVSRSLSGRKLEMAKLGFCWHGGKVTP